MDEECNLLSASIIILYYLDPKTATKYDFLSNLLKHCRILVRDCRIFVSVFQVKEDHNNVTFATRSDHIDSLFE